MTKPTKIYKTAAHNLRYRKSRKGKCNVTLFRQQQQHQQQQQGTPRERPTCSSTPQPPEGLDRFKKLENRSADKLQNSLLDAIENSPSKQIKTRSVRHSLGFIPSSTLSTTSVGKVKVSGYKIVNTDLLVSAMNEFAICRSCKKPKGKNYLSAKIP